MTVQAKYLGTAPVGAVEALRFEITLDTHSVNLDQYDLKQLALLQNDRGVAVKPVSFEKKGASCAGRCSRVGRRRWLSSFRTTASGSCWSE